MSFYCHSAFYVEILDDALKILSEAKSWLDSQ